MITKGWEQVPVFQHIILPVVKVVWGLFTSHRTFNDILMLVNVFLSLKITLLKTLDFLQQTSQWMRMCSGKWLKIRCYSLWVRDFPFHCFIFIWKKNRLEVYCFAFVLFSHCIDHFICYSCIVYIGDSLGHVICLLIYFRLAACFNVVEHFEVH